MRQLKKILLVLFMFLLVFVGYVEIVNRNSKNMTYRQKVLKAVYPAFMWWSRVKHKNNEELSNDKKLPPVSFYSLSDTLNNGSEMDFEFFKGRKILLVNTASNCGYTNQYEELQKLSDKYNNLLTIIAFPANDFKEQEQGNDKEIAEFCKLNYGVSFPLMQKSIVVKKPGQNPVFQWLTDSSRNGWNNKAPTWNFCKYLVNEQGILTNYFGSAVSPLSKDVISAILKK
jgi:glutathione peroxidase